MGSYKLQDYLLFIYSSNSIIWVESLINTGNMSEDINSTTLLQILRGPLSTSEGVLPSSLNKAFLFLQKKGFVKREIRVIKQNNESHWILLPIEILKAYESFAVI